MPIDESLTQKISHLDGDGSVRMVNVVTKPISVRVAKADGWLLVAKKTMTSWEDESPKGNIITTAEVAGIMAAEKTSTLIPMCHSLMIDHVAVTIKPIIDQGFHIKSSVTSTGRTGVEMEAITAVTVAALTLYDMLKSIQKDMVISKIRLLSKRGGTKGSWHAEGSHQA